MYNAVHNCDNTFVGIRFMDWESTYIAVMHVGDFGLLHYSEWYLWSLMFNSLTNPSDLSYIL